MRTDIVNKIKSTVNFAGRGQDVFPLASVAFAAQNRYNKKANFRGIFVFFGVPRFRVWWVSALVFWRKMRWQNDFVFPDG